MMRTYAGIKMNMMAWRSSASLAIWSGDLTLSFTTSNTVYNPYTRYKVASIKGTATLSYNVFLTAIIPQFRIKQYNADRSSNIDNQDSAS